MPIVPIFISVVVPVYSGADFLEELVQEIGRLREEWAASDNPLRLTELVMVDDASIDVSGTLLDEIKRRNDWITILHLSRNFGQHAATIAGILHTSGDWVVTLDEDMQHPPSQIIAMLKIAIETRSDIVYANSESAVHESRFRDGASRLYKSLISLVTGNPNVRSFSSFRLIRGSIARAASSSCGHDTYFDLSLSWFSQTVSTLVIPLKDRRFILHKTSGYNIKRLISHARRMFMSSGTRLMRAASVLGLLVVLCSVLAGLSLALHHIYASEGHLVRGWASLIVSIVFCSGFIIFLLGIVLEYVAVLVLNAHGKPLFFIVDRRSDDILLEYFSRNRM
jgi:undecaprenyl-phosphate 4-deoxy-4-formamido-L-arabinose transferase